MLSGDGGREGPRRTMRSTPPVAPAPQESPERVAHNATCDLCDSGIIGDRYVCYLSSLIQKNYLPLFLLRNAFLAQISTLAARALGEFSFYACFFRRLINHFKYYSRTTSRSLFRPTAEI